MMTYAPYETITRPTAGLFGGLPKAEPGTVLVVDRENHDLRALQDHSDRLTAGEARFGRIRTLYRVDVSEHPLEFTASLPCSDDAGGFDAHVHLTCRVKDAAAVVERGVTDVARCVVPLLTDILRKTARTFVAEDASAAEEACIAALGSWDRADRHDDAFAISNVAVVLRLDADAARYVRQHKESLRERARLQDQARLRAEAAQAEAELARQQAEFEAERQRASVAYETERLGLERARQAVEAELALERSRSDRQRLDLEQELTFTSASQLDLKRLEFEQERTRAQAELDKLRVSLATERDELVAARELASTRARLQREQLVVDRYLALLASGDYGLAALRLMEEPTAVEDVAAMLAGRRDVEANLQLQTLTAMLQNKALEGWQYTDEALAVLKQLVGTWTRELSTAAAVTPSPAEGTDVAGEPDEIIDLTDDHFVEPDGS